MLVEVIGGLISGSLALLADAGHMLTDTMSLTLAWVAFGVSARPPDVKRTYGYHRVQILAAFVNGASLLVIVGWILIEAVQRFRQPTEILGGTMLGVAIVGLLANIAVFLMLRGGERNNLNIRGAMLHVLGDLLGSLAAIIAAVVILATGWTPIDPILSIVVALLILRSGWHLVKQSGHILLEGAPEWLDVESMQTILVKQIGGLESIHHVHVWSLTPQRLMLTMHATLQPDCRNVTTVIQQLKQMLRNTYGIEHSTIEVETSKCADDSAETLSLREEET